MEIPQEVLDSRVLTVYTDTDPELVFLVESYNKRMVDNQKQKRKLKMLESIFLMLNIAMPIIVGIIGLKAGGMFIIKPRIEWLEVAVLILFLAAYIFFGMIKRNLIAVTAFSVPLIIMDFRCILMVGVNVVLTAFDVKYGRILTTLQGYPNFARIHIEKKNCKEPKKAHKDKDGPE